MAGLIGACIVLAILCMILIIQKIYLAYRIRKLAEQLDGFNSGTSEILDVALQEDRLAQLHNGIADLQQSLVRTKQLNSEECIRTSQLTADISHQLKTPLASLRLFCEMDESAHVNEQLSQIERMERLIQSLLRLERLCADGYEFSYAEQDMASLVRESWQGLASVYPNKKLRIEGNATIRCDEKWLGEAYLNLLKNACEHTPEDGEITVHLEQSDTAFFCSVSDNGGGVDAKELPHLFDRFYRAHSRETKGAGIGLSIVKEIIRRHHGSIYAENVPGGLRMNITLPILQMIRT